MAVTICDLHIALAGIKGPPTLSTFANLNPIIVMYYHDRSIHQCLQRINRENRICMRKHQHQLDRIYLAYKVLSQLPQLNIRCLPFFMYFVSTNFRSSSYTLQASQIFTLFCLVFLPPQKKQKIIHTKPEYCSQPKPLCFRHPYNRVLHQSPGKLFQSWKLVPCDLFGHETKIERQKKQNQWVFACIDIFQMIQMYGILITYMY